MPKVNPRIKSLNDLLGVDTEPESTIPEEGEVVQTPNGVQYLPPKLIRSFHQHPFRLYEGDRLNDLVESIQENGVLIPVIVRKIEPDENGFAYEMLAGHNRQHAASIAGLDTIPCIVKENLSDEDAWIYVIETNAAYHHWGADTQWYDGLSWIQQYERLSAIPNSLSCW